MLQTIQRTAKWAACVIAINFFTTAEAQDSMQTGDGLLMIEASMPESARVGEQFTYNVAVTNTSENVILHDVKLEQRKAKGFTVESVSIEGQQNDSKDESQGQSKDGSTEDGSTKDEQSSQQKSSSESANSKDHPMHISTLQPGESRTFVVKASADEEGELRSCLQVTSYTPALCLSSQIVKPELELTKVAPKQVNRCSVIELNYKVKNGGSGDVGKFVVTDSLGDGLATIEGDSELSFNVDGLAAGETREFVARVYAKKTGTFSSRAAAKAENNDLKSRSKETTTEVIAADLTANVTGPSRIYGNDMATFNASITNTGNVAAESVNVTLHWPSQANLADLSDYTTKKSDSSNQPSKNQGSGSEPTLAAEQGENDQSDRSKQGDSDGDKMQMQTESFVIDRLEAGESAEFTYAIRTDNLDKLPTKVVARYVCTVDAAEDQAKSTDKATAMAMATPEVVRLAALQIAVVDDEDPVKNGSKVQYTISVWNEGDAPDQNVQLVAMLPNNLKFDSADGPTELKNDGGKITFDPIKSLEPGDRIEYTVTAKPTGTGNARFEAALTSKMLQQEVVGEEPTRLFDSARK